MKRFSQLIEECRQRVAEIYPWDLAQHLESPDPPLLLDVREPYEFDAMRIEGSLQVPRGILESACEWGYEETVPELVQARDREVVVICRSGNRSLLAADILLSMGYSRAVSLRTGLRGWNDYEQPLVDRHGNGVSLDASDDYFMPKVSKQQLGPR
ncbi:MAG: rhodanese-like domain-containing protein [Gammaproteobacteria bacterium]|jgi:rhodanese-related sulfurtransferase